ncbi:hypothetical protein M3Y94_01323000 [Aphelenchoides besseyi]|nr:hypothetical protein M3Y94_01323000 [Aphelenchoides besseyi]
MQQVSRNMRTLLFVSLMIVIVSFTSMPTTSPPARRLLRLKKDKYKFLRCSGVLRDARR